MSRDTDHLLGPELLPRHTMTTGSGRVIDLLQPDPQQISVSDMVMALGRLPRWNGHTTTSRPWTVADHSVLAAHMAESRAITDKEVDPEEIPILKFYGLTHDFHEAYIGDLIGPVQAAIQIASPAAARAVGEMSRRIDAAIYRSMGVPALHKLNTQIRGRIWLADMDALHWEASNLRMDERGLATLESYLAERRVIPHKPVMPPHILLGWHDNIHTNLFNLLEPVRRWAKKQGFSYE